MDKSEGYQHLVFRKRSIYLLYLYSVGFISKNNFNYAYFKYSFDFYKYTNHSK